MLMELFSEIFAMLAVVGIFAYIFHRSQSPTQCPKCHRLFYLKEGKKKICPECGYSAKKLED